MSVILVLEKWSQTDRSLGLTDQLATKFQVKVKKKKKIFER